MPNYLFLLFINLGLLFSEPCPSLQDTKWVLFAYKDMTDNQDVVLSESDYLTGCSVKYVLSFSKKNRMLLEINDKWIRSGKYKIGNGCEMNISFPVGEKVYDGENPCMIDTIRLIAVGYAINYATSYEVSEDTLIIHYTTLGEATNISGDLRFKKVSS